MTRLRTRKSKLQFTTESVVQRRNVVIEVDGYGLGGTVRLAGTRTRLPFTWDGLYFHAARVKADTERRERIAARKAKKRA